MVKFSGTQVEGRFVARLNVTPTDVRLGAPLPVVLEPASNE